MSPSAVRGGRSSTECGRVTSRGIQRYFSEPLSDRDVTALRRILGRLIAANEETRR